MELAILLNTCDKYADVWKPFFDALSNCWDVSDINIYINSESVDYVDDRFNIINVHPTKVMPWSDRLKYCVSQIKEEYILNIEEECILEAKVDVKHIELAMTMHKNNKNIASIWLMHVPCAIEENDEEFLPYVKRKYDYRNLIIQQSCIWKRSKWLNYIKANENPWEYESLGSARGVYDQDEFYVVRDDQAEVLKYGYGYLIFRGYWCSEELEKLEKMGYSFDKTKREILTRAEIEKLATKINAFFFTLRIKKYMILLRKKFKI